MTSYGKAQALDTHGNSVSIQVTDELVQQVTALVRAVGVADKRWDVNLAEGKQAESVVRELLDGSQQVEVKRDFKCSITGNMAIEEFCSGKPSGINATEAGWWGLMLDGSDEREAGYNGEVIVLIKTSRLKRLIKSARSMTGGDKQRAQFRLLPVQGLLTKLVGRSENVINKPATDTTAVRIIKR